MRLLALTIASALNAIVLACRLPDITSCGLWPCPLYSVIWRAEYMDDMYGVRACCLVGV